MMWRPRPGVLAAFAVVAVLVMTPSAAFAVFDPTQRGAGDPQGGQWHLSEQGVYAAHEAGFKGQGVKVAVIDSRINPDLPEFAGAKLTIHEPSFCTAIDGSAISTTTQLGSAFHGTSMANLIVGNGVEGGVMGVAPEAELLYYNAFVLSRDYGADMDISPFNTCNMGKVEEGKAFALAMQQAVADGADVISISTGSNHDPLFDEVILDALHAGIIIVTGFANDSDVQTSTSSVANGTLVAMSYDASGELRPNDKTGEFVADEMIDIVGPGVDIITRNPDGWEGWDSTYLSSGNSNATALTSGMIAVVMSKYPKATGNQIMQSILRNTTQGNGELRKDQTNQWGYGKFDLTKTLSVDPTQYPDINPELSKDVAAMPTYEEVMGTPDPEPSTPDNNATTGSDSPSMVWIIAGIAAVIVAAIVIITVIARSRKKQPTPGPGPGYYGNIPSHPGQGQGQGQSMPYPNQPQGQPAPRTPHPGMVGPPSWQGGPGHNPQQPQQGIGFPPGETSPLPLPPAGRPDTPPPGRRPDTPSPGGPMNGTDESWR